MIIRFIAIPINVAGRGVKLTDRKGVWVEITETINNGTFSTEHVSYLLLFPFFKTRKYTFIDSLAVARRPTIEFPFLPILLFGLVA